MAASTVRKTELPKKFHQAVLKWRDAYMPDWGFMEANWKKYFPHQPEFQLCALNDCSVCPHIEVGVDKGKPKFTSACEMNKEQADHLLKAVKAQASTELGSIQQHRLTLARADDEQDQFWILRMMAEELRHGYQMFSVLLNDDWRSVTDTSGEDMVEEVLNMRTGSHVLGAFNIDFDSFLDNITFCAFIDRVGKFQLDMQKVSAYRPMSESMGPMLREEAFHLATGVGPLRRWAADFGEGKGTVSFDMMQRAINKWFPRALDMFGDERGGGRNVAFGFKHSKNGEAMMAYVEEVDQLVRDLNERFLRARFPDLDRDRAREILDKNESYEGVHHDDLLSLPDVKFFRRRGPHAFEMRDRDGGEIHDFESFRQHMMAVLPEPYPMGRDFMNYFTRMEKVANGTLTPVDAMREMPELSRVGGTCACSNAVRWVQPENGNGAANN